MKKITCPTKLKHSWILISFICAICTQAHSQWSLTGNAGTNSSVNFTGTSDNHSFVIRSNNTNRIFVDSTGKVGIGTSTPTYQLQFSGGKFNLNATNTTVSSLIKSKYKLEIQNGTTSTTFATFDAINQRVGIGTTSPVSKLHVKGNTNVSQLIVDANITQSNTNPLIKLRNSSGTDLLWIHSDDTTNTFIGRNAGRVNNAGGGGPWNTFIGSNSGYSNTTGEANTANGYLALYSNTTGNFNTASGKGALYSNTTGNFNTASGDETLYSNTTGSNNTVNGLLALYWNTTGNENTANGRSALFYNIAGNYNTANGANALYYNTANNNTANGDIVRFIPTPQERIIPPADMLRFIPTQ